MANRYSTEGRTADNRRRAIGPFGTATRIGLVLFVAIVFFLVASAGELEWHTPVLGFLVFPAMSLLVIMTWQGIRGTPIQGNGAVAIVINHVIIFGLVAVPFTSLAAGLFYGTSTLLAVVRG